MLLYQTPNDTTRAIVKTMVVCNTTGSATTYSVWVNQAGTATGDEFAHYKTFPLAANATDVHTFAGDSETGIILFGSNASIIVAAAVASAVNFTLYGIEVEEV